MSRDTVPVEPFREAFLASGRSAADVARSMGCYSTRLRRMLGLVPDTSGYTNQRVSYANAVRLCDALGLDYVEMGV